MFDIGMGEMLLIAIVAIIVVGPKDLPQMLRTIGKVVGQLKRQAAEFKTQFDDAIRDSEISDIKDTLDGVVKDNPVTEFEKSIKDDFDQIEESYREKAMTGPESSSVDDFADDAVSSDGDYPADEPAPEPAKVAKAKSTKTAKAKKSKAASKTVASKAASETAA